MPYAKNLGGDSLSAMERIEFLLVYLGAFATLCALVLASRWRLTGLYTSGTPRAQSTLLDRVMASFVVPSRIPFQCTTTNGALTGQ